MSPVQMPIVLIIALAALAAGVLAGWLSRRSIAEKKLGGAELEARQIVETASGQSRDDHQGGRARIQGVPAAGQGRLREGDARQAPGILRHGEAARAEGREHRAQGQPDRAQGNRAGPARQPPLRAREVPRREGKGHRPPHRRGAARPREERRDDRGAGAPPHHREPPGRGQVRVGAHDPQGRGGDAADLGQEGQGDHQHRDPALRERLRRRIHRLGGAAAERGDEGPHHRPRGAQHPHPRGGDRRRPDHRRHAGGRHPVGLRPRAPPDRQDFPRTPDRRRAHPPGAHRGGRREGQEGDRPGHPRGRRAGDLRPRRAQRPPGDRAPRSGG